MLLAAAYNHHEIVRYLFTRGGDPDIQDNVRSPPPLFIIYLLVVVFLS